MALLRRDGTAILTVLHRINAARMAADMANGEGRHEDDDVTTSSIGESSVSEADQHENEGVSDAADDDDDDVVVNTDPPASSSLSPAPVNQHTYMTRLRARTLQSYHGRRPTVEEDDEDRTNTATHAPERNNTHTRRGRHHVSTLRPRRNDNVEEESAEEDDDELLFMRALQQIEEDAVNTITSAAATFLQLPTGMFIRTRPVQLVDTIPLAVMEAAPSSSHHYHHQHAATSQRGQPLRLEHDMHRQDDDDIADSTERQQRHRQRSTRRNRRD